MDARSPRNLQKNQPVLITQKTVERIELFPEVEHYCGFLAKLQGGKYRYGYSVLGFGLTPVSIYLILIPLETELTRAMQSLFTSAAAKLRWTHGKRGRVFSGNFTSEPLLSEKDLKKAQGKLIEAVRRETKVPPEIWPFVAIDCQQDRFNIIDTHGTPQQAPGDASLKPPFLTKNGMPTINWYLSVADLLRHK